MSTFRALHLLSRRKILNHLVHNPWLFNQNTRGRGNDSLCSYSVILWSNSKEVNERSASLFWSGVGGGSVVMRSLTSLYLHFKYSPETGRAMTCSIAWIVHRNSNAMKTVFQLLLTMEIPLYKTTNFDIWNLELS